MVSSSREALRIPFPEPCEFAVLNADLTAIEPVEQRVDTLMRWRRTRGRISSSSRRGGRRMTGSSDGRSLEARATSDLDQLRTWSGSADAVPDAADLFRED